MTTATDLDIDGLHTGISFSDYHAIDAVSASVLRAMRRGPPARVLWERENPSPDTDATRLGTAVHCAFITPDLYEVLYAIKPDGMTFASKEGKAWRDDPCRRGKPLLSFDEGEKVHGIVAALEQKEPAYASLTGAAYREVVVLNRDPETGERLKARPDWFDDEAVTDLKVSIAAERPKSLAYRAFVEGWMHQVAFYRSVLNLHGRPTRLGRLIVVSPKAPHYIHLLEVKPDSLDLLALDNEEHIRRYAACKKAGEFPGTPDTWTYIEPPPTALVEAGILNDVEEVA